MKKSIIILLSALATLAMGCSGSDDSRNEPQPAPTDTTSQKGDEDKKLQPIEQGSDTRPEWTAPDSRNYEQNMTVYLKIQERLKPYVSENDLVCAKIDGDVRGISTPINDCEEWLLPLIIFSNGGAPIQLYYYCDNLHRIFTTDWIDFDSSLPPTGDSVTYYPKFVEE